jgi:hypothetical protein
MSHRIERVIALGASNLTRGFHTIVSAARAEWGAGVQVVGAMGHGRSYGAPSRFVFRVLPGILESDLWRELEAMPPAVTRGLVTDVGNDLLYGFSSDQTLAWIEQALDRLQRYTDDIVVTGLPVGNIKRLSNARFLLFRTAFFPYNRLSLREVADAAARVDDGIARLASARGLRHVRLDPDWYGFDPIHIRPPLWREAWNRILCGRPLPQARAPVHETLRLYLLPPQRQWVCGVERLAPQTGIALERGGRVWLY